MVSLRFPPTFIPTTPRSQPLITFPLPIWNGNGFFPGPIEVSNTKFVLSSRPV